MPRASGIAKRPSIRGSALGPGHGRRAALPAYRRAPRGAAQRESLASVAGIESRCARSRARRIRGLCSRASGTVDREHQPGELPTASPRATRRRRRACGAARCHQRGRATRRGARLWQRNGDPRAWAMDVGRPARATHAEPTRCRGQQRSRRRDVRGPRRASDSAVRACNRSVRQPEPRHIVVALAPKGSFNFGSPMARTARANPQLFGSGIVHKVRGSARFSSLASSKP
jgi:hypothetical protein